MKTIAETKRNLKRQLITAALLSAAFVFFTLLVYSADVRPVGVRGTNVGFAALNTKFFKLTGVHMTLYTVTDWLGLVPAAVCTVFCAVGICQLVKRKSLFKVDADIIILGFYYAAVIAVYLIFETIPINYRPVLIDGRAEASYPSSTTLLVLCIMPTLVYEVKRRVKNKTTVKCILAAAYAFSAFMVTGRLVSGVHWFSDIVGGVLLSAAMYSLFKLAVCIFGKEKL